MEVGRERKYFGVGEGVEEEGRGGTGLRGGREGGRGGLVM